MSTGDRVLIFSQFAVMGELLRKYLQKFFGREVLFLHGSVPARQRDDMVIRFQEEREGPEIFILSLKAGGVGLNLTRANQQNLFVTCGLQLMGKRRRPLTLP
jgi:SNF2 family DNA or RNA helicase